MSGKAPNPEELKARIDAKYKAAQTENRFSNNKLLLNPAPVGLRTELSGDDIEVGNYISAWANVLGKTTLFPFAELFKEIDEDFERRMVNKDRKGELAFVTVQSAEGREPDMLQGLKMLMEKRAKEE
jgi:hypothetical protein